MSVQHEFYKENDKDLIYWVDNPRIIGEHLFSFDMYPLSWTTKKEGYFYWYTN